MKRGEKNLVNVLTLSLVLLLLISMMSITLGTSNTETSHHLSIEDSCDGSDQFDVSIEDLTHELDSNSTENDSYEPLAETQVDIMMLYTSNAQEWASTNEGSIHSVINEAVDMTNTVMDNSNIDLTLNIVHTSQVDYTETGDDLRTDISRLRNQHDGYMEEIHNWRDYYGADLVSLFVETDEDSEALGIGSAPSSESSLHSNNAYSVVCVEYATDDDMYVFTHEIGHNFGAGHAKDQDRSPGPQLYDYSAGWRWITGTLGFRRRYRTVMAYDTYDYGLFDYELVPYFSNPDIEHEDNDEPMGCPDDADNARTIRETKDTISDYQEPTPQIDITSPSFGEELYQGMEHEIEWETVSGDNSVSHVDLYYSLDNGTTWNTIEEGVSDTGSYEWEVPLEETDSALIGAEATDEAGFSRDDFTHFEIEIDDIPPEIDLIGPEEGEIFQEKELTVRWDGSDDYSGIDRYEITSFGTDWEETVITEDGQYTFTYLEDGEHEIEIRAFDNAGNENTTSVNITVDTIPPNLNIDDPIDGERFEPGDVTIFWNGSDDITGISRFEIRIGEDDWITVSEDTSHTFEDLEEGNFTVEVRAVDEAGNTAVEKVEFEVEEQTIAGTAVDLFLGYIWIFAIVLSAFLMVFFLIAKRKKSHRSNDGYNSLAIKDLAECGNCGSVIPGYLSNCSKCGVEFSDMVKCKNCGSEIYDDVDECPECGSDFRLNDDELGDM